MTIVQGPRRKSTLPLFLSLPTKNEGRKKWNDGYFWQSVAVFDYPYFQVQSLVKLVSCTKRSMKSCRNIQRGNGEGDEKSNRRGIKHSKKKRRHPHFFNTCKHFFFCVFVTKTCVPLCLLNTSWQQHANGSLSLSVVETRTLLPWEKKKKIHSPPPFSHHATPYYSPR